MPDQSTSSPARKTGVTPKRTLTVLVALVAVAGFLTPLSSELPDGLESAIERLPGHREPGVPDSSLPDLNDFPRAGPLLGILLAGAAGWALHALGSPRRRNPR